MSANSLAKYRPQPREPAIIRPPLPSRDWRLLWLLLTLMCVGADEGESVQNAPHRRIVKTAEPILAEAQALVFDVDGDGFQDVIARGARALWVTKMPGGQRRPGALEPRSLARPDGYGASLTRGDWNRDGVLDLAVGAPDAARVLVLLGPDLQRAHEIPSPGLPSGPSSFGAAMASVEVSGGDTLLIADPTNRAVYRWDGLEAHLAPIATEVSADGFGRLIAVADATVAISAEASVFVFPDFGRTTNAPREIPFSGSGMALGDVTGDGAIDLITLGEGPASSVSVLVGPDHRRRVPLPGKGGTSLHLGDFDGDGFLDIASGRLLWPGGTLGMPKEFELVDGEWVAFDDVNGDGRHDLIARRDSVPGLEVFDSTSSKPSQAYGQGAPDHDGFVPRLTLEGTLQTGTSSTLRLTNVLGGAMGVLVVGAERGASPLRNATLGVHRPITFRTFRVAGPPGVPGAGHLSLPIHVPDFDHHQGIGLHLQLLVRDPRLPDRFFAQSPGLSLTIQPRSPESERTTMQEFRFRADLSERDVRLLTAKAITFVVLLLLVAVTLRLAGPWRPIAWMVTAIAGLNLLLDLGQVGLVYNHFGVHGIGALSPLFASFDLAYRWPLFVHVAIMGTVIFYKADSFLRPDRSGAFFALAVFVLGILSPLTSNLSSALDVVLFQFFESDLDYIHHAPPLSGFDSYLRDFVSIQSSLSMHASTHGPGAILLLTALQGLLGDSAFAISLALQALSATIPLATLVLARAFVDERTARLAALLVLVSPTYHLFSFVSMEGVFSILVLAASIALVLAIFTPSPARMVGLSILLGILAYLGALFTFSISFLGPLGFAVGLLARQRGTVSLTRLVAIAAISLLSFAVILFLFATRLGFDLIACFQVAQEVIGVTMGAGYRTPSHLLFCGLGNLGAFLIGCGLPASGLWISSLWATRTETTPQATLGLGAAIAIFLIGTLGLYQWETERIWMFLLPWVALGAARRLSELGSERIVLALVWLQALAMEVLLDTYW